MPTRCSLTTDGGAEHERTGVGLALALRQAEEGHSALPDRNGHFEARVCELADRLAALARVAGAIPCPP